ncbi:MAG: tRNA (adenosine(37)-N6)-threonylcarbamoyltransferase complex dimerization subunit type 1 TsaB [Candidatus Neomarinimicrobiota bacterium]
MGMDLLAIETASSVCGIALFLEGEFEGMVESELGREHAEKLPLFYEELRDRHEFSLPTLTGIAVSIGPGSFTGLRIGLSYGKGLAYSAGIPLVPVPTLTAMAMGTGKKEGKLRCLLHSHKNVVYSQDFLISDGYPIEQKNPKSGTWEKALQTLPRDISICQYGCDHLLQAESGLEMNHAAPSARCVGELSLLDFEKLKVENFYEVAPNYISPFKVRAAGSSDR